MGARGPVGIPLTQAGPPGYTISCAETVNHEPSADFLLRLVRQGATISGSDGNPLSEGSDFDAFEAPGLWGNPASWSKDHLTRYNGWSEQEIDATIHGTGFRESYDVGAKSFTDSARALGRCGARRFG